VRRNPEKDAAVNPAAGFSLIEIVVALALLSLLAGAAAPFAARQIESNRLRATQERMKRVVAGMAGDPWTGDHGYLGDIGELPPTLDDLNTRGSKPVYVIDANDGVGAGYNGPYVPQAGPAGVPFSDAWGTGFQYAAGAAQLTSAGGDRIFGSGDDLVFPDAAPVTTGSLTVSVTGLPNDGGVECLLGEDDADVIVASSSSGTRSDAQLPGPVGTGGPFSGAGLHNGFHGVRVVGQGEWAGAALRDVVEIRGSTAQLRVTLIQPPGPPPGC
jgi:prepilin-type N-terminal cleavage/methylation domain-containing protein